MTILSSAAIIVSGKECLKDWLIVGRNSGYTYGKSQRLWV